MVDIYYMIRAGGMGTTFELHLYLIIFAILLIIIDWRRFKRKDYLWVLLFGSLILIIMEGFIQFKGVRDIQGTLYGVEVPTWASVLIMGIAEGDVLELLFYSSVIVLSIVIHLLKMQNQDSFQNYPDLFEEILVFSGH